VEWPIGLGPACGAMNLTFPTNAASSQLFLNFYIAGEVTFLRPLSEPILSLPPGGAPSHQPQFASANRQD